MKMTNNLTTEQKLEIIHRNGASKEQLLRILLELQNESEQSYIDEETAQLVAKELGMTFAKMYEVLSFYAMLETKPSAKFVIEVCNSTPCHFSKSQWIADFLEETLGVKMGETTKDGMFAYHFVSCVGACDIGPVMKIKDDVYGHLTKDKVVKILEELKNSVLCNN